MKNEEEEAEAVEMRREKEGGLIWGGVWPSHVPCT